MEIIQTTLAELNQEQIQRLRRMTLPSEESWMKRTLDYFDTDSAILHPPDPFRDKLTKEDIIIAIAKEERNIGEKSRWLGWALIRPWYFNRQLVMIFIKPLYRKRGIGKKLVNFLRENHEFDCYPWDFGSETFFQKIKIRPYWWTAR